MLRPILIAALLLPAALVVAQVNSAFDPNKLLDDKVFADIQTFGGAAGIQKFLESKNSPLAGTSADFLIKLKEPGITLLKQSLDDPEPNLGRLRSAAELIWDAAQSSGLNPQVILVTLNKEQSLITGQRDASPAALQKALDRAMGFDCPDGSGCGNLFPGFYYQLFGNFDSNGNRYLGSARSLMKSYNTPGGRGPQVNGRPVRVGETVALDNTQGPPYNAAAQSLVTLANKATAALYRYTPHVFNGNYNFWRFFSAWFKYANGTLVKLSTGPEIYIIQNGTRQLVPAFVAIARNLILTNTIAVSPTELEDYPKDLPLGPKDNTLIKIPGQSQYYVFLDNIKHPASDFVLKQRGLNPIFALTVNQSEADLFNQGGVLTPSDGTVVRGQKSPEVYLVQNGQLQLFSAFTFSQRKVQKHVQVIADTELATYPKAGFVPPLSGTLVKASDKPSVYLVENGLKQPISGAVFKNRGFSFKQVASLSPDEIANLPIGAFAAPKERTYFTVDKTGQLYIFKEGSKHPISAFVAKQRGITPDFTFSAGEAGEWLDGIAIPPRDNTLVKGNADPVVYVVLKGQLRPLTGEAFKKRRFSFKNVRALPQAEVDAYAKGDDIQN